LGLPPGFREGFERAPMSTSIPRCLKITGPPWRGQPAGVQSRFVQPTDRKFPPYRIPTKGYYISHISELFLISTGFIYILPEVYRVFFICCQPSSPERKRRTGSRCRRINKNENVTGLFDPDKEPGLFFCRIDQNLDKKKIGEIVNVSAQFIPAGAFAVDDDTDNDQNDCYHTCNNEEDTGTEC
jgi:hypothetical protein